MAPEVLNPSAKCHDASKADIWSFGITLIELLRGRPPLHYLTPRAAMAAIPRTSPPRLESDDPGASKMLRELIHTCLHDDPKKRPSASQLLKTFKSYFKQQKYNTIPGSLARLGRKPTSNNEQQTTNNNQLNYKTPKSETIYSQWDFDLSTLATDEEQLAINPETEQEIEIEKESVIFKTEPEIEIVKTLVDIIREDTPTQTENPPAEPAKTLKFRKLLPKKSKNKVDGWGNKDTSILPIPCPHDAPDLSRPQYL